jgi:hypothetical protein
MSNGRLQKNQSRKTSEGQMMQHREDLARRYGFESFAELLDISDPLPMMPGDTTHSYVARDRRGYWFVWVDPQPVALAKGDGNDKTALPAVPLPGHASK